MPFVECPSCHSSYHVGALYERHDVCPRCGTPFAPDPRIRLRSRIFSHRPSPEVDWEAVTGSQYGPRTRPLGKRDQDSEGPS
jgi:hypothetical protein